MSWYNNHSGEGDSPSNADNWFYISDAYYQGSFWTPEYENSGSTSGYGDGTGASMNISFKFRISHGMLAGNDWSVRVTAVDFNGQETPQTATGVTVLYFGSVVAQRESVDFGSLTGGEDGIVNDLWDGAMTANASSDLTYKATSFSYLTNELALATGLPSAAPSAGKVAFDCNPSTTWDEGTALRLAATPKTARTGLYAGGTGEMGGDDLRHSCRVWFGGSAPVANQYYNSTFTVGIGAGGI
jgi:hypothetical protein